MLVSQRILKILGLDRRLNFFEAGHLERLFRLIELGNDLLGNFHICLQFFDRFFIFDVDIVGVDGLLPLPVSGETQILQLVRIEEVVLMARLLLQVALLFTRAEFEVIPGQEGHLSGHY